MTLSAGSTLGPYAILAELGHGGMGVVYTAQDPRLDGQVAIQRPGGRSAPSLDLSPPSRPFSARRARSG